MKITTLKLNNFRNYKSLILDFSNKQNIIIGSNGVGKTNIVEAIYVLAITKSFRGSLDKVLINSNSNEAIIEGRIKDHIFHDYKICLTQDGKTVKIDNNKIVKLSDYISKINVILFTPEDTNIIKDSPMSRRNMINIEISQFDHTYLHLLNEYNKVLKQRNAFLKLMYVNKLASPDYLWILTEKLIELGIKISSIRNSFIDKINTYYDDIYNSITNKHGIKVSYVSSFKNKNADELMKKYRYYLDKDIVLGKTSIGIHHDDIIFSINNNN